MIDKKPAQSRLDNLLKSWNVRYTMNTKRIRAMVARADLEGRVSPEAEKQIFPEIERRQPVYNMQYLKTNGVN